MTSGSGALPVELCRQQSRVWDCGNVSKRRPERADSCQRSCRKLPAPCREPVGPAPARNRAAQSPLRASWCHPVDDDLRAARHPSGGTTWPSMSRPCRPGGDGRRHRPCAWAGPWSPVIGELRRTGTAVKGPKGQGGHGATDRGRTGSRSVGLGDRRACRRDHLRAGAGREPRGAHRGRGRAALGGVRRWCGRRCFPW